ncbi:hypothetical protein M422DRAFT_150789, partial [Sphaerobolus stellatus SS14]
KGRAEIERVISPGQMPTYDDLKELPYWESLVKETLQLYPPLPLGENYLVITTPS